MGERGTEERRERSQQKKGAYRSEQFNAVVGVEVFAFATRHPEHPVARGIHGIGHAIQAVVATREPEDAELLVGAAALREICRVEGIAADSAA